MLEVEITRLNVCINGLAADLMARSDPAPRDYSNEPPYHRQFDD